MFDPQNVPDGHATTIESILLRTRVLSMYVALFFSMENKELQHAHLGGTCVFFFFFFSSSS